VECKISLARANEVYRYRSQNKGCSTHHSPLESGRGGFALLAAAAEAKVGAMVTMGELRSSAGGGVEAKDFGSTEAGAATVVVQVRRRQVGQRCRWVGGGCKCCVCVTFSRVPGK
jgi:hypothetical protein